MLYTKTINDTIKYLVLQLHNKMKSKPQVSILIVNYNGQHLLNDCLSSVFSINYPKNKFEVIVVDNNSQDDSVSFIKKNFKKVKLIESQKNLGFAGGNNTAYKHAKGEYIVLLNNDTKVQKNWLIELVNTANSNENVGIVSSKLLFDIPFIEVEINSPTDVKSNIIIDSQEYVPYGVIIDGINCDTAEKNHYIWYKRGFYEPIIGNYTSRWTDGHGVLLLPFINKDKETYNFSIHGRPNSFNERLEITIKCGNEILYKGSVDSKEVKQINLTINRKDIKDQLIYLVQNAGNNLFKNGLGRDRGSVIKRAVNETKEFYDYDSDFYNKEIKLLAMCGASCLIKRSVINSPTLFDDAYFMYYEDVDLSLKIWRSGYDIIYQPKSVVYHKHRATTNKQTSAFFLSNVDKNHLFFLLTHFPLKIFIIQFIIFLFKLSTAYLVVTIFEFLHYYGRVYKSYSVKLEARSIAFRRFKENANRIYKIRKQIEQTQKRGFTELFKELY
jgi:GT2 family glycosyltransferase